MIVVDIGCATYPSEQSVYKLADRFRPDVIFGFDPQMHVEVPEWYGRITTIFRSNLAAWTHDGVLAFEGDGIAAGVQALATRLTGKGDRQVACFDVCRFLETLLSTGSRVVLKLDCEGAEFPILHSLADRGIDARLELVLVEWHEGTASKGDYWGHGWARLGRPVLDCPVEEWA